MDQSAGARPPLRDRLIGFWRRRSRPARIGMVGGVAGILILGVAWAHCGLAGCPDVRRLTSYQPGGASVLLDRDGKPFADLAPVEGEVVPLESLPPHVPQAFIVAEDRRFYEHGAVDLRRVMGALLANLKAGGYEEGSSTLTMQLARNAFPDRIPGQKRTLGRKLLEIRVAQEIESQFSKDEILELYLNHIYFGNGARGIEAAARHYFGMPASKLDLPQAALLAGLPKGPRHYDPRRNPKPARERRDLVLGLMEEHFGNDLYDEPLRIRTTLDTRLQNAAEEELDRQLRAVESGALGRFPGPRYVPGAEVDEEGTAYLQGAVVALAAETGDVLAWVGGRDFRQSRFDRVRFSRRQVGSAFKPWSRAPRSGPASSLLSHASPRWPSARCR